MEGEKAPAEGQMRMKWESLQQEVSAKQRLLRDALAQEQEQVVPHVSLFCTHSCRRCTAWLRQYNCVVLYIFIFNAK